MSTHGAHDVAIEKSLTASFEDARDAITNKMIDLLGVYKTNVAGRPSHDAQLLLPPTMRALPLLLLALQKSEAFRPGSLVSLDRRAYALFLLRTMSVTETLQWLHPDLYPLHDMPAGVGTVDTATGQVVLPRAVPLSSERLSRQGLYLLDDGRAFYMWVGRDVDPALLMHLFDRPSYASLSAGKVRVDGLPCTSLFIL